jgi:hypothetical protein
MEIPADWTGGMACALQAVLRLSNVAFAAHLESACGWVAAWRQKPALALAAGRCSSVPALPLGRSRCRSGCDSLCSHMSSAMPGRACRIPKPGPPDGYNAGTPARTRAALHTTSSAGRGNPRSRPAPAYASAASGPGPRMATGVTAPDLVPRGRRRTGGPGPGDVPPAVATTGATRPAAPGRRHVRFAAGPPGDAEGDALGNRSGCPSWHVRCRGRR